MLYTITHIPETIGSTVSIALTEAEINDQEILTAIELALESFGECISEALKIKTVDGRLETLSNINHDLQLFVFDTKERIKEEENIWEVSDFVSEVITEELLLKYAVPNRQITEFNTKVVGTSFRNPEDIEAVEDGDFVLLDPEVGNPHDPFACRVVHDKTGAHIGYVKKIDDAGKLLSKEIWENTIKLGDLYLGKIEVTGGVAGKAKGFNLTVRRIHVPQEQDARKESGEQ